MAKFMTAPTSAGQVCAEGATIITVTTTGAVAAGDVTASGVFLDAASASGKSVRFMTSGIVSVKCDGAVTAGARLLISETEGKTTCVTATPSAEQTAKNVPCGIALTSAADGGIAVMEIDF